MEKKIIIGIAFAVIAIIIRITMNSTTDHLCNKSKNPGDYSPGKKG